MIVWFSMIAGALVVIMAIGIILMGRVQRSVVSSMRFLFFSAIMTILCYVISINIRAEWASMLVHALYFAFTDWLVFALFLFTKEYTGYLKDRKWVTGLLASFSALDTLSLVANLYLKHIFECEWLENDSIACYIVHTKLPGYLTHILIVYPMAVFVVVLFWIKTVRTLKLYRKKYEAILISFITVLAANVIYRFIDIFPIDISVLFYGILAAAIGYFALLYVPKGLTVSLLAFSVRDMSMGILCYDLEGRCIYINDMAKQLFARMDCHTMADMEQYYAEWAANNDGELEDCEWREQQIIEGESRYYETKFKKLLDKEGNFVGSYFCISDTTEEVLKYEKEHYRATHDELTGVFNWIGFMEQTHKVLEEDRDMKRCIVCVDVKDFKLYNDMFGVEAGDDLLKKISAMMQKEASEYTVYGRLSGDRFAMCMPERLFGVERMTNYIKAVAAQVDNEVYHIHIQMGVYHITDTSMDVAVMCDRAMIAIKSIKSDYQSYVAIYDEAMGDALHKEKKLLDGFTDALEQEQFQMYLQPQIASDGTLLGAEALVRWQHPVDGLIPPCDFIPLFERTGYIHRLDMFVWELACKKLAQWKKNGREDLHISVNISAKDFYYIDLYETFTGLVKKYDIAPKNLKLEITETAVMKETGKQLKLLDRLREYGFHIEIDDFGSGYSSLNTLKDMNVDVVKMDMGFLRKTDYPERSRIIMDSMINMSKRLGIAVITEGVETKEQVAFLKTAGCNMFQGYYFDKPMPTEHFEEKYKLIG